MPIYRNTAFFRDDDGHGWTETHDWDSASSSDLDLSARVEAFNLLMRSRRVPLLAGDAFYLGCRVSKFNPGSNLKQQSLPLFLDTPDPGTAGFPGVGTPMDAAMLAVKVTFADSAGTARSDIYLRGVWDQVIQAGQLNFNGVAGSKFAQLLKDYQDALAQNGYGWVGKAPTSGAGRVDAYTAQPNGTIRFTLAGTSGGPFPFTGQSTTFYFSRINNSESILNRAIVCAMDGEFACVTLTPHAAGPFVSPGRFYIRNPAFFRYGLVAYRKLSSRKTGRPIGVGRGRLPARNVY